MRKNAKIPVWGFAALTALLLVFGGPAVAGAMENTSECLACHSNTVTAGQYAHSAHKDLACTVCHLTDPTATPPTAEGKTCVAAFGPTQCASCHSRIVDQYQQSIHNSKRLPVSCGQCHKDIHTVQSVDKDKFRTAKVCSGCHSWQQSYFESDHYAALQQGKQDSPTCTDCHGVHDIAKVDTDTQGRMFHTLACLKCHNDDEMMNRNNVEVIAGRTYFDSFHGKNFRLGFPERVAGCADCHMAHKVKNADDPDSSVHQGNLEKTCGHCHAGANANFVKFQPHACHCSRDKYPVLYWTFIFMSSLLIGTFVFFWAHTLLWWRKTYWDRRHLCNEGEVVDPRLSDIPLPARCYWRFKPIARIMHVILITSFYALVLTGMPLRFAESPIAARFIRLMGGAHTAGIIHRTAAIILVSLFSVTLVLSIRFLLNRKNGATFLERLFSPDSLFPRKKDWEDFKGMVIWFFNKGPEPEFDRWTYWEKFDFLAVFWGMTAIGLSGLLLWLPEATARLLPGWLFNVATIIHSDEALLATGFIFTVHFFNTHLIPTKFPMDNVIFTGRIRKWQFIREKPLYWKRLEESGRLDAMQATQPSIWVMLASSVIGYTALLIGLAIMALAVIEMLF